MDLTGAIKRLWTKALATVRTEGPLLELSGLVTYFGACMWLIEMFSV